MRYRIATTALLTIALLASAAPAMAQTTVEETKAGPAKVKLETRKTAAVIQGGSSWVALNWRGARADAADFRITATANARGVEISYPDNTGSHSSLMDNDILSPDEVDFTALHLVVPYGTKTFQLKVVAMWNDGKKDVKKRFNVTVPTFKHEGKDVALVTESGVVSSVTPSWVDVDWSGLAPSIGDVRMVVGSPNGATVVYPGERAWSSLSFDDRLDQGETDVARFLLDASGLKPGIHEFKVLLTYSRGSSAFDIGGVVKITVKG